MKTVRTHPTTAKKMYRRPVLSQFGSVGKLTKGKLGSKFDAGGDPFKFDGINNQ